MAPPPGASSSSTRASTSGSAGCTRRAASTMSTSSLETIVQRGNRLFYRYGATFRPMRAETISLARTPARWLARRAALHHLRHPSRADRARRRPALDRAGADASPGRGASAKLAAHQGARLRGLHAGRRAPGQFVERHHLCRRRRHDRLSPPAISADPRRPLRLARARRRQRSGDRLARPDPARSPADRPQPARPLALQRQ